MFPSPSHRAQFFVLFSSFFTLHLFCLCGLNSFCLQPVLGDDTQLLHSCPPDQIHTTAHTMQTCISDVKTWMTQNKLKLNDNKTEALFIKSNRTTFPGAQPISLCHGSAGIPFTLCACSQPCMPLDKHSSNVCRSADVNIRRMCSIHQYLTVEATNTLTCACLLSTLDYCNSLLPGRPLSILNSLQFRVM